MMMHLKTSELVSLNQRLIPPQLARAFGIATSEDVDTEPDEVPVKPSTYNRSLQYNLQAASRKRLQDETEEAVAIPAEEESAGQPTAILQALPKPVVPQPHLAANSNHAQQQHVQPDPNMAHALPGSVSAPGTAALLQQPMQTSQSALAAQAATAAALQTTSGLSAGYAHHHPHHAAAVHVAAAHAAQNAAVMHSLHGYPAAYGLNPHAASLLPYMAPAHQAMAVSNITGSLGCAPMSVYSGPSDYGQMARSQQEEPVDDNQARALKRPRLVWTPQLHTLFEEAVAKLGVDKAVPKTIMQMMNVEGLTRENVASHLQKYRLSIKKQEPDGKAGALAADAVEATSADKAQQQQQDATGTSAAVTGGSADGGTGSSAGNGGGGGGSCSSSGPAGSTCSKDTRSDKAASGGTAAMADAAAAAAAGMLDAISTPETAAVHGAGEQGQ